MGTGIGMCYEGKGGSEMEAGRGVEEPYLHSSSSIASWTMKSQGLPAKMRLCKMRLCRAWGVHVQWGQEESTDTARERAGRK